MISTKLTEVISAMGITSDLSETVEFRDNGGVYLTGVKRPTFLYDKELGLRMKYGEREEVDKILETWSSHYKSVGFDAVAEDLAVLEVPPNQELVDALFQSSGVFKEFIESLNAEESRQEDTT